MNNDDVQVWEWDLDNPGLADASVLSHAELARASRFIVPDAGRRFVAGRAALRQALAPLRGVPAAELTIEAGPNGKPFLQGGPHFNLAHSGPVALFALADFPIGIDVEAMRPVEPGLARSVFTPGELEYLATQAGDEWQAAFFRGWTRKEAIIKAKGGSIADLQGIVVLPEVRLAGWQVVDLAAGPGYAAAVAAPRRGWAVTRRVPESGA